MKRLVVTFFIGFSSSFCWAGDAGTTSANFLKLGIGPRATAMGEAQVGLADDVFAAYWNPAGLAQLETKEAGFVQNQYFQDIHEQYLAYAQPTRALGTFAGSLTYLGIGNFQGYDAAGQPTGDVSAHDVAAGFSYAKSLMENTRLGSRLSVGVTGKWIQESLDNVSASAYAADIGVLFTPGHLWGEWTDGWRAGLALRNLGSSVTFDRESAPLPRSVTAGLSYSSVFWEKPVVLTSDFQQPNDGARVFGVGFEMAALKFLFLRAGYTTFGDLGSGLRIGGGLRFNILQVDYSFSGGGDFGNAHRIGIVLHFGEPAPNPERLAQRWYERGEKDFKKGHYTDAIVEFNKALEIDPQHPHAYDMMQKTYENLKASTPH